MSAKCGKNVEKKMVIIRRIEQSQSKTQIRDSLYNILNYLKNQDKIKIFRRAKIMIKPNLCCIKGYETGATVDPFLVRCLVEWLLQNYDIDIIFIGESDATKLDADIAFEVLGWKHTFKSFSKVQLLNLTKDEYVEVKLNGLFFKELYMPKTYMESDFLISVAKLKTHIDVGMTCILKNQFGANPYKYKIKYHKFLNEVIHDLNKVRLPDLCIVDGIIAMEGDGPVDGIPKAAGIIVAGDDPVATDHMCARIMEMNPNKISYLKLATQQGLGGTDYEISGENLEVVKTKFRSGHPLWRRIVENVYNIIARLR